MSLIRIIGACITLRIAAKPVIGRGNRVTYNRSQDRATAHLIEDEGLFGGYRLLVGTNWTMQIYDFQMIVV
jgi:hypothetical protein